MTGNETIIKELNVGIIDNSGGAVNEDNAGCHVVDGGKTQKSTEQYLRNVTERTRCMLGGELSFEPVGGFITHTHDEAGEMLVPGFIISKTETNRFRRDGKMDSAKLERSMRYVLESMNIEGDIMRTEKGLWMGAGTAKRLVDGIEKKLQEEDSMSQLPGGPLPYEYFVSAFLTPQGKILAR